MMKRFGSTQVKKWFVDQVKPTILSNGFRVGNDMGHKAFIKDSSYGMYSCYIEATAAINTQALVDVLSFSPASIRLHQVETILGQVLGNDAYIEAGKTFFIYPTQAYGATRRQIILQDDIEPLVETFKQVFTEEYLPAFDRFSDYHNVLAFWDSLTTSKEKGLHFQDSNNYTKILILSKMCNDEAYEKRVDESLSFYQAKIDNGEEYYQEELKNCRLVINYLTL